MKVLVTGGTGAFGMAVCRQLARAGADPVAMARNEPARLPNGVQFVAGDVRDADAVQRALSGCDAVVHLAWFMGVGANVDQIRQVNIGGTTTLLDAMERAGCNRLVFTSSTTAYGNSEHHPEPFKEHEPLSPASSFLYASQKRDVEELIARRGFDAAVARVTVVLGRQVDNGPSQAYAGSTLFDIGGRSRVQAVHQDDVGRFLERAVLGSWQGTVNLAAPGSVSMAHAGELLGRRVTTVPLGVALRSANVIGRLGFSGLDSDVARTLAYWPVADSTRLTDDWGFEPVWEQEAILEDQARSASRSTYMVPDTAMRPRRRRLPWAETTPPDASVLRPASQLRHAAPEGIRGSMDTMIDDAYPLYSGTNLHEAFPGPMTPLSLELAIHGLSAAADALTKLFGLKGDVADLLRLGVASFGHRVYANVSAARLMADLVPGATVQDVDRMYLGVDSPAAHKSRPSVRDVVTAIGLGGRVVPRLAGFGGEVDRLVDDARRLAEVDASVFGDAELLAHLALLHDMICQAWATSSTGNFLLSGLTSAVDGDANAGGRSAGGTALDGVQELARRVAANREVVDALGDGPVTGESLGELRGRFPWLDHAVEDLIQRCGHRGPGETELANPVFADCPELLVDLVRRVVGGTRAAPTTFRGHARRHPLARVARGVLEHKERARDAGVRLIDAFRRSVRERARRLVDNDLLTSSDDVFFLTYEELFTATPPSASVLAQRRTERERLARYRMPLTFEGAWEPVEVSTPVAVPGDELTGVAAVPGIYEGTARIMSSPTDELEPDEILVATTTDIGWTPYFALAGAVVTDVGGVASHAAIVAREHGIPSVVAVGDATSRLRSGMSVRVDGSAGTVTVLTT